MKTMDFPYAPFIIAFLFLMVSFPYIVPDLWMDEVISFWEFWRLGKFQEVFLHYPIANNHILFSALMWLWCKFLGTNCGDIFLRIPCIAFAFISFLFLFYWGRKRFPYTGIFFSLVFCFSPIYLAFVYQLRGYGVSLFLAILLSAGFWEFQIKNYRQGFFLSIPAILLLPGIMPSNVLIVASTIMALGIVFYLRKSREWWVLAVLFPFLILGLFPYFMIWKQFLLVLKDPLGWESPFSALGNIILALAIHLGILFLFLARLIYEQKKLKKRISPQYPCWILFGVSLFILILSLFMRQPSPYPRTYLVFFPLFTLPFMALAEELYIKEEFKRIGKKSLLLILACFALCAAIYQRISYSLVQNQIAKGLYPQNLLMQYYQNSHSASQLVKDLEIESIYIIGDFHQWLTFRHYWVLKGNNPDYVIDARNRKTVARITEEPLNLLILASNQQKAWECVKLEKQYSLILWYGSGMYKLFSLTNN
ncbi:MAG: hypothetical protein HUU50_16755 [Candidatus Brocadiae bacterium]|nr:hypothetical protein [Candidatus Brocadiia bacterium]